MFDYLIAGAGFAGSVMAERLAADAGKKVLIIDKRPHIGGNAYDHYDAAGILIHKYGPHIFHTNSRAVFEYLSRFTEWRPYQHRVLAHVDGQPTDSRGTAAPAIDTTVIADPWTASGMRAWRWHEKRPSKTSRRLPGHVIGGTLRRPRQSQLGQEI
jgi:choline dehydrogenase-like flavoprotein